MGVEIVIVYRTRELKSGHAIRKIQNSALIKTKIVFIYLVFFVKYGVTESTKSVSVAPCITKGKTFNASTLTMCMENLETIEKDKR